MNKPAQYFRAGVGALIINEAGCVLALERADIPGAWQLPQGGLEEGEGPKAAAIREIEEETGITESHLEFVDAYPNPLAYELPSGARRKKTGRGQVQYWFLFKFTGGKSAIDVKSGGEFSSWRWMPFEELHEAVIEFRKQVYKQLADYFAAYLSHNE